MGVLKEMIASLKRQPRSPDRRLQERVDWLVPDVEVALLGRTRLIVVVRRLAAAAGGALGVQILAFLSGK
jgi:hypothetical protein